MRPCRRSPHSVTEEPDNMLIMRWESISPDQLEYAPLLTEIISKNQYVIALGERLGRVHDCLREQQNENKTGSLCLRFINHG